MKNFYCRGILNFNEDDTEPILSEFLEQYEAKNIMKNKTCFKNLDRPTLH